MAESSIEAQNHALRWNGTAEALSVAFVSVGMTLLPYALLAVGLLLVMLGHSGPGVFAVLFGCITIVPQAIAALRGTDAAKRDQSNE